MAILTIDHIICQRALGSAVEARGEFLPQLMEAAAKIPFDDRKNLSAMLSHEGPA